MLDFSTKRIAWNADKNAQLREERGIGFEEIVFHIENGGILEVRMHHNQEKYPGQRILVVGTADYAYLVPFVESEDEVFLKTIFPSRKAAEKHGRRKR